jgi:hypothetical protein
MKDESVVTPGGSFKYVLLDTLGIFLNEWHCTDCIMYVLKGVSSPSYGFDTNEFLQSFNTFFSNIKLVLTDQKNLLVLFI